MMIFLLKRRNFFTDETEYGAVLACNRYSGLEKPRCDLKERGILYRNLIIESSDQGKIGPKNHLCFSKWLAGRGSVKPNCQQQSWKPSDGTACAHVNQSKHGVCCLSSSFSLAGISSLCWLDGSCGSALKFLDGCSYGVLVGLGLILEAPPLEEIEEMCVAWAFGI